MIAFILTVLYASMALLSPSALPPAITALHVANILGGLAIFAIALNIVNVNIWAIPETYLVFGVLVTTIASTLATGWFGGAVDVFLGFFPIVCCYYFITISSRSISRLRILVSALTLVALFIVLQGVFDDWRGDFLSPYLESELMTDTIVYRHRGLGVLNDPNDLAQFLTMMIPLLWLRWKEGNYFGNAVFTVLPAMVLLFGVYETHSRGGIISLIAVLLFGLKDRLGLVKSSVLAAAALTVTVVLNTSGGRGMNEDDGGRVAAWVLGLELFRAHPIFGVGVGRFAEYNDTFLTAHNSYVLGLAELGLQGYFFWIGMLVSGWIGLRSLISMSKLAPETTAARSGLRWTPPRRAPLRAANNLNFAVADGGYSRAVVSRPWELSPADTDRVIDTPEEVAHTARIFQVALVGLLTSSFFLSRTYSTSVYVLLGMAVALRETSATPVVIRIWPLVRKICYTVAGSILFLYLFIRIRGVS